MTEIRVYRAVIDGPNGTTYYPPTPSREIAESQVKSERGAGVTAWLEGVEPRWVKLAEDDTAYGPTARDRA